LLLLALFCEFVGGFFVWIGFKSLVTTWVRRRTWLPVEGLVTGFEKSRGKQRSGVAFTVYRPFYRYFVEGKKYVGVSDTGSPRNRRYRVKDPIRLLVNPKSPGESMVLDFGTWLFSWGIFLVGLIPMAMGLVIAVDILAGKGQ